MKAFNIDAWFTMTAREEAEYADEDETKKVELDDCDRFEDELKASGRW